MTQLLLDVSPAWILLCVLTALAYAMLLYYRTRSTWSTRTNRLLFAVRWIVVFTLTLLLLGFMVRHFENQYEKPVFAILLDNSASVQYGVDSTQRKELIQQISSLREMLEKKDFEVPLLGLRGNELNEIQFNEQGTNLSDALRMAANRYEGRRLEAVLLISDGIYTSGLSPADLDFRAPVFTVGLGDTVLRPDLAVRDVLYNKITYQGNRFPVRAEIRASGFAGQTVGISLSYKGRVVEEQRKTIPPSGYVQVEFLPEAKEEGLHRWDVAVEVKPDELNRQNNRASFFIEVVKGKRKILLLAAAPHPDIRALRLILEQNSNYDVILHIPGIQETDNKNLRPENVDVVILYQLPDGRGRLRELTHQFIKGPNPRLYVTGSTSDLSLFMQPSFPVGFEVQPRQFDEVTPALNPLFNQFSLPQDAAAVFYGMPPLSVRFGKMRISSGVTTVLYQQVGNVITERPLLAFFTEEGHKTALLLGEGLYRWRMYEFSKTGRTETVDELFLKLIQFLATPDDKSKFRCFTLKPEFSEEEPVIFESQVYNDIYEPVYGNTIELSISDEQNKRKVYSYVLQPSSSRYIVEGLDEGAYRFSASTETGGRRETVNGRFVVTGKQIELQSLTADFDLLRRLSKNTGGKFFTSNQLDALKQELSKSEARYVMRSEERYTAALNVPWILALLIVLVSVEWFLRKFYGGY
ncbi:MAG: hypothetical protein NZM13_01310 [Cyclobacteriaceae bacterium]|nr:hypothetical protein [Cyclobacteriaceae bacterium]